MRNFIYVLLVSLLVGHLSFSVMNSALWIASMYLHPEGFGGESLIGGLLHRFVRDLMFPELLFVLYIVFGAIVTFFVNRVVFCVNKIMIWSFCTGIFMPVISYFSKSGNSLAVLMFFVPLLLLTSFAFWKRLSIER